MSKGWRGIRGILLGVLVFFLALIGIYIEPSAFAPTNQPPAPGYYAVSEVHDGDTISVLMNNKHERIRFIGVDTPETHDPRKAVQCFGKAATEYTKKLLEGTTVRLEADPLSSNRDRYDRLLRYVYTQDNTLVNQQIIEDGYGFAYTSFPFTKSDDFKASEKRAQDDSRGLWSACNPELDSNGYISTEDE